jgi:hypothetical protein
MVAVAAAMEAPAIITALYLAKARADGNSGGMEPETLREVLLNGSIVLLLGAFLIGWITGKPGYTAIAPFIDSPFKGLLCLFLLDMGIIAGRGLRDARHSLKRPVILFGLYTPLIGAVLGLIAGRLIGLSTGGVAVLATLAASASYIAVPAALRLALPEARPAVYLPLSLGITFPFNLTLGIPLYVALAGAAT